MQRKPLHSAVPSMTESSPWSFDRVFDFAKAYDADVYDEQDKRSALFSKAEPEQLHYSPQSLGDFSRIYQALGISPPPLNLKPLDSPPELVFDRPSSPSSLSEHVEDFDDFITGPAAKGVRWHDQLESTGPHTRESHGKAALADYTYYRDVEPDGKRPKVPSSSPFHLVPASVLLPPPTTPKKLSNTIFELDLDPLVIRPSKLLSSAEQKEILAKRLRKRFKDTTSLFEGDLKAAIYNFGKFDPQGIHVFVDFSNIIIGFANKIKAARGLHEKAFVKQPPISYHSLSLVLERGRPVARRCLVGSTSKSLYTQSGSQNVPKHFSEAEICGYELNILDRVSKIKPVTPVRRKKNGTGNGYATLTSGDESAAITELKRPVMMEQAVDELLQFKILESLLDFSEPTTIVLASGDAAEAEYSGGFLKAVKRALTMGWNVEILAWRDGLSREYQNKDFVKKWGDKFRVIQMDDFAEDMLAIYDE